MKINNIEKLFVTLIFLFIFGFMATVLSINWYNGMGDNATYADITLNIAKTGKSTSQILATVIDYIFQEKLVNITPDKVSTLNLEAHPYNLNTLKFHFTPIQFFLAPLSKIVPINILWGSITAFSFLGVLFLGYFILRNGRISIIGTFFLLSVISLHPAWNYSIFGQFYVDRLFLISGMLLLYFSGKIKPNIFLIVLGATISSLIIEKTAIICGIFLVIFSILYWNKLPHRLHFQLLFLGITVGLFGYFIIKYYLNNSYYSSFISVSSLRNFASYLSSYPHAFQNLLTFIFINLPILLLGIFEWKTLTIAITMMIPNIFGNLGGAEKVGWVTHYHTTYFPFLFWSGILGYVSLQKKVKNKFYNLLFYGIFILTAIFYGNADQITDFSLKQFSLSRAVYGSWPIKTLLILKDSFNPTGKYQNQKNIEKFIDANIPIGSTVSVPENLMIYLFQKYKVYYYPLGLDNVDYVVLHINNDPNLPIFSGIYTYLGSDNNYKIDALLLNRMVEKGYDTHHPKIFGNVAIIKRTGQINKK